MGIYVDIDLDYLVKPVQLKSTNNIRTYKNNHCEVSDADEFIEKIKNKGLLNVRERKFFTNHKKSYTYWWIRKMYDMTLIHIDAHSDLYRNRNMNLTILNNMEMGCDDYIWYGIRDGFISKIFWVVPEGLYDLGSMELAKQFISESMIIDSSCEEGVMKIKFSVSTRVGEKEISYTICTIDKLPKIEGAEMLTVATSPEFVPEAADCVFERVLNELGAADEEIKRIMDMHANMPCE
jgi:hypothetical protein